MLQLTAISKMRTVLVLGPRKPWRVRQVRASVVEKLREQDRICGTRLMVTGTSFSSTVIIFHPQVCADSSNSGLIVRNAALVLVPSKDRGGSPSAGFGG
jgi:hypothetical protein